MGVTAATGARPAASSTSPTPGAAPASTSASTTAAAAPAPREDGERAASAAVRARPLPSASIRRRSSNGASTVAAAVVQLLASRPHQRDPAASAGRRGPRLELRGALGLEPAVHEQDELAPPGARRRRMGWSPSDMRS